ncbi:MAG: biopolymer transporter ExbD [Solitalea sp.]
MANVEVSESQKKGGKKAIRGKKRDTRIDMTPMVDLGFLLITFFILTTTLNQPQAMDLIVPAKEDVLDNEQDRNKVGDEQAFTILLGANNRMLYYEGLFTSNSDELKPVEASWGTGENSIRAALVRKSRERNPRYDQIPVLQKQLNAGQISEEEFREQVTEIRSYKQGAIVMIKASPEATYENMVDILDEIKIANVGIYAIMEITPQELTMLEETFN